MRLQRFSPVLLIAAALVGCGGDEKGGAPAGATGPDPAQAIPADAPVYIEAVVRPEGEQGDNVRGLLERFLGDTTLVELIDKELAEEGQSYAEDIEPWLGSRAGIGLFDFTNDEPSFVAAVAVTDTAAAETAIADAGDVEKGPMAGDVQLYLDDEDDSVAGVSDDFLLIGESEAAVTNAIETVDGESVADSERFTSAFEEVPSERLGALYIDTQAFVEVAAQDESLDPAARAVIDELLGEGEPVTGALIADPDSARMEFRLSNNSFGPLSAFIAGESSELVAEAPADAWLTFGYTDVGETVQGAIEEFAGAFGGAALTGQIEAQTGLDLERDFFSWIGDVAIFARGETEDTIDGAAVISVTDTDAAEAAIPRIVEAAERTGAQVQETSISGAEQAYTVPAPGAPGPVVLAYGNERVVIAVGERAAEDALEPSETISDSGLFERAEETLDGVAPAFILDYDGIIALAESSGSIDDPDYEELRPYLEMIELIASGAESDGDDFRSVIAVKAR